MEVKKKTIGLVLNYYTNISVAIVELVDDLSKGDKISIEGENTKIQQTVESMQIEHKTIDKATKGSSIGLKTVGRCRKGDKVYLIS